MNTEYQHGYKAFSGKFRVFTNYYHSQRGKMTVISRLDRYLLRSNMGLFFGLLALALSILLMERLIRLAELISGSDRIFISAAKLITNLVPHYVELALPGAMLITIIISVNRFSRSSEITVLLSSGVSLYRIARPYLLMGAVSALVSLVIAGFLQPLTRYNFRQTVFELQQSSVVTAFKEFKFVQFKDQTIWSDSVDPSGTKLGQTFITQKQEDGSSRFLVGKKGQLYTTEDGTWSIRLTDAMIGEAPAEKVNSNGTRFITGQVDWKLPAAQELFRERGKDHRELTLLELINKTYTNSQFEIDPVKAEADMHDRLSRSALLLFLPLIGIVLGLDLRRNPRTGGVMIGILLLLLIQKSMEFAHDRAEDGDVAAWMAMWPVPILVGVVALVMFYRAANGHYSWNGIRNPFKSESEDDDPSPTVGNMA